MLKTLRCTQKAKTQSQSQTKKIINEKPKEKDFAQGYLYTHRVYPLNKRAYRLHNHRKFEANDKKIDDQKE